MPMTMFQFTEEELLMAPQYYSQLIPEHLKHLTGTSLAVVPANRVNDGAIGVAIDH